MRVVYLKNILIFYKLIMYDTVLCKKLITNCRTNCILKTLALNPLPNLYYHKRKFKHKSIQYLK